MKVTPTQEEDRAPQKDYSDRAEGQKVVLEGSIPSSAWDMEYTSHAGMVGCTFIQAEQRSNNNFALADGHPTPATNLSKLEHKM